jgi:hypothetical protein
MPLNQTTSPCERIAPAGPLGVGERARVEAALGEEAVPCDDACSEVVGDACGYGCCALGDIWGDGPKEGEAHDGEGERLGEAVEGAELAQGSGLVKARQQVAVEAVGERTGGG